MKIFNLTLIMTIICLTVNAQVFTNKVNVKKGQTIEVLSKVIQTMDMGMEMKTNNNITSSFTVEDVTESELKVKSRVVKIISSADMMGTTVEYDSEKPDSENNPQMLAAMKEQLNSTKEFSINRTTLEAKNLTKSDSEEKNPMEELIGASGLDESAAAVEMLFLIPNGKKPGDSWTVNSVISGNKSQNNYTLKEVKDGVASVDFKILYKLDKTIPVNGMDVPFKITVTSTGNLTVSTETGVVKKKSSTSISEGTMELMGEESPISSQTVVESTFIIK